MFFCNHYSESSETFAIPAQFTIFSTVSAVLSSICSVYCVKARFFYILADLLNWTNLTRKTTKKKEAY